MSRESVVRQLFLSDVCDLPTTNLSSARRQPDFLRVQYRSGTMVHAHFNLLVQVDGFLMGCLLIGITVPKLSYIEEDLAQLEAVSLALQVISFGVFTGAIMTATIIPDDGDQFWIPVWLSCCGIVFLFGAIFTVAAVRLYHQNKEDLVIVSA